MGGQDPDRSTQTTALDVRRITGTVLPPFSSLVRIDVSALSHTGHLRENNEDQFFVTKVSRALETMLSSLPPGDVPERVEEVNYVMIVADGMGATPPESSQAGWRSARSSASRWSNPAWILKLDSSQRRPNWSVARGTSCSRPAR